MNRSKHVPNLTLPMRERSITQQNQIKSKPIMILSKRKEKKRRKQNKKKGGGCKLKSIRSEIFCLSSGC